MRILITTFGTRGDLDPYLALGRGLATRGHEPVIATHEHYRHVVSTEGIDFRPIRPDAHPGDREFFARAMHPRRGPRVVVKEAVLPFLVESYADTSEAARDAEVLVTHPLAFAAPIVAEERGLPWISTVLAPMSYFSRHDLPVLSPAPGARRFYGVPGVPGLLVRVFRAITRSWTRPVRALRTERGLPPGGNPLGEGMHSPRLALGLFSPVLAEPQPDWPPAARITGFLFRDPSAGDDSESARVASFLDSGPPPIVFTLGSSAVVVAGSFYEESLGAARRLGMRAVLLVGDDPANRPALLGDDAIAVERASHHDLFARAAAIVHHGGIGTLGQALRAGRPMLVVPWSHDQPDNGHRAARLGVARVLSARRYRADRAAEALRDLIEDPAVAARAASVSEVVRSEDGVTAACDAIEEAILWPDRSA